MAEIIYKGQAAIEADYIHRRWNRLWSEDGKRMPVFAQRLYAVYIYDAAACYSLRELAEIVGADSYRVDWWVKMLVREGILHRKQHHFTWVYYVSPSKSILVVNDERNEK